MRLISWNVNGIRAVLKKGFLQWFHDESPDILCLQETKAHPEQLPPELRQVEGYRVEYCAGQRRGYSGVSTWSRPVPTSTQRGFGDETRFDTEGRILISDVGDFVLLNIYFPNGQKDDERLQYKLAFYEAAQAFCNRLRDDGRHLVICGDVNTAHREIDLARPKQNAKTSGFLPVEREWLDRFLADGYVDCFRRLHPDATEQYSWWSMQQRARDRNVGWRIDYFFVDEGLWPRVQACSIHSEVMGSDHCPISLDLS